MQALRLCARRRVCWLAPDFPRRTLSSKSPSGSSPSTYAPGPIPWFMDPSDVPAPLPQKAHTSKPQAPPPRVQQQALPAEIPPDSPIASLHAALSTSPHLEPGTLKVRRPISTALGPPLLDSPPKGRRKRGRTYAGEGVYDQVGDIWDWIVLAQVKEGTENRGAIESVVRIVRRVLLTHLPPLPLPPNIKRRVNGGWAMIDAGDFAVHIVSKEAREKFFPDGRREW
ncbi:hypothetical protein FOMPIDRAFT_1021226 [Fomitopsis schrenkii]|uniref:Uncharacterized protein n=1 Tax=Fomitopsis schrenkii TaxID=2126942 RepID=S8EQ88_FOMSC|nr:hypothetical protein FOMPIDRAFT_1021226 [Fomitopsis schrenkii]